MNKKIIIFIFSVFLAAISSAAVTLSSTTSVSLSSGTVAKSSTSAEVKLSTTPVGSNFIRFLADDFKMEVKELSKYEKRGFGRAEIITLVLISKKSGKKMKEYGNERLKKGTPLRDMAQREGMDYDELYKKVYVIKGDIEARGDINLPPPVFEPVASPVPW